MTLDVNSMLVAGVMSLSIVFNIYQARKYKHLAMLTSAMAGRLMLEEDDSLGEG